MPQALVTAMLLAALAGGALGNSNPLTAGCAPLPVEEGRLCRSVDVLVDGAARLCRNAGGPAGACDGVDGEHVGEDAVRAYEAGWAHRAQALQRALMDALPLRLSLFPSTHNTFNAEAYAPTLSGLDPNQHYAIAQQLRMDMRAIEFDPHWFPSLAAMGQGPILCHGNDDYVPHAGCTLERPFAAGLEELRAWLDANPGEVVLLYVDEHLDRAEGFDAAAADLAGVLGERVLRPGAAGCEAGRPLSASRDDIRARGAQVLVVSRCGEGAAWRSWVHDYAVGNIESVDFTPYPDCGGIPRATYDASWVRFFEDRTWVAAMVGSDGDLIDAPTLRDMVRCGANMPSLDLLDPADGRLEAFLWSWAEGEPALAGPACAAQALGGRFAARACGAALPFACLAADGAWRITAALGSWSAGGAACAAEGAAFRVPRTGYEQQQLVEARHQGNGELWVRYADLDGDGAWEA